MTRPATMTNRAPWGPAPSALARFAGPAVVALLLAACSGGPASSTGTPSPTTTVGTPTAGPTTAGPTTAGPTPAPTGTPEALSGRIAFQRGRPDGVDLFTIDPDGSNERPLVANAEIPRWSPDGSIIAIAAHAPGDRVLPAFVAPDGSGFRQLEPDPTLNLGASAWSPDGQWLAYESWDETNASRAGIYLMHPDGTELARLTEAGIPGAFSPDGRQLAFLRLDANDVGHLWLVNVDGTNEHRVSDLEMGIYVGFMPDGQSLYAPSQGRMLVVDLDGNVLATISAPEARITEGRLSADGLHFIVVYEDQAAASPGLYRIRVDGPGFAKVVHTNAAGIEEVAPDWSR